MNKQRRIITAAAIALASMVLTTGCASHVHSHNVSRRASVIGQSAVLYVNSSYVSRVTRPVSYFSSLASYTVKSGGGLARRATLHALQMPTLDGAVMDVANAEPMDLDDFERQLDRLTGTHQTKGTVDFRVDGEEYFTRLERAIDDATSSIDIRTYIFDNDDYGVEIADRLKRRSATVRVRVMVDGLGNTQAMQVDPDSMPVDFLPPLSMADYMENDSDVRVRYVANPFLTGDHTKTTIIDGRIAFVGGMNIGREYRYDWHDLMMELRGPVVDDLQFESDKAWARSGILGDIANFVRYIEGKKELAEEIGAPIRILQTRNFDSDIYTAQLAAVRNARSYIIIENAYFSDDLMQFELAKARRRGVDVRVILPAAGNHGALNASNKVATNMMLENGIRVFIYPGMSHVKAAIFDGWVCVGSANLDKLSLQVNKELNIATSDPEIATKLMQKVFLPDLAVSEEIFEPYSIDLRARLAEMVVDEFL